MARVQALLRRSPAVSRRSRDGVSYDGSWRSYGWTSSRTKQCQRRSGFELTPIEYRLLAALIRHRGQVVGPVRLLELAWSDPSGIGPERVKYSVMRLRRKLSQNASPGRDPGSSIEAVRGFGYRYVAPRH